MFPKVLTLLAVCGLMASPAAWAAGGDDYDACVAETYPPLTWGECDATSFIGLESALVKYSAKAGSVEVADVEQVMDHQCAFARLLEHHLQRIFVQDACYEEHIGPLMTSLDEMPSIEEVQDAMLLAVEHRALALSAPEKAGPSTGVASVSTTSARRAAARPTVSKSDPDDCVPTRSKEEWVPSDPLCETGGGPSVVEDFDGDMDWDKTAWGPSVFNNVLGDFGVPQERGRWTIIYPNDSPASGYATSCEYINHWTKVFMEQTSTEAFVLIDVDGGTVLAHIVGWGDPIPSPAGEGLFMPIVEFVAGPTEVDGYAVGPEWWNVLVENAVSEAGAPNWWSSDLCVNSLIDP